MAPSSTRRAASAKPRKESPRYEELIDKAAKVIAANGYAEATIADIAAQMDMSGPALYYYVKSKDELLYEIWKRAGGKLQSDIDVVTAEKIPPEAKLERAFRHHLQIILADKPIFEVLILQRSLLPAVNRHKLVDSERRYLNSFAFLVGQYLDAQALTGNATLLALGAVNMLNGALRWYSPKDELSLDDIAGMYFRLFTHGAGR